MIICLSTLQITTQFLFNIFYLKLEKFEKYFIMYPTKLFSLNDWKVIFYKMKLFSS